MELQLQYEVIPIEDIPPAKGKAFQAFFQRLRNAAIGETVIYKRAACFLTIEDALKTLTNHADAKQYAFDARIVDNYSIEAKRK